MKWFLFSFLVLFIGFNVFGQSKLDSAFLEFRRDKSLLNANISFQVIDLDKDTLYQAFNDTISLPAASTVKLFSTASAIEILGKDYKPKTKVYTNVLLDSLGVLDGNLIVKGAADISIGSQYFSVDDTLNRIMAVWADTLYKLGLRKVKGKLIGDGSAFGYKGAPDGWTWEDLGNYYGAFPCGLSIYDNMVRYYFYVGPSRTRPILTSTFPVIPNLILRNNLISLNGVGDNSLVYGGPYSYERTIRGSLGSNNKAFLVKGSMPDPENQFLFALKEAMVKRGISIEGEVLGLRTAGDNVSSPIDYTNKLVLFEHIGKSVADVAYWTNMKSVNVFAETLTSWIGVENNGDGSIENGVSVIENYWKDKIYANGLDLTDGSGLSRSNSVNARNFCSLLHYMYHSNNKDAFLNTLPVAGQTGTLAYFCKGQCSEGKIMAKSGTMRRIKSYAGYVNAVSGKRLAFALIVTNYSCSNNAIMKKMESVMNAMYLQ
jgi:D-alanyl-D-alanine carboxypeptidase/D-alanyl-D-alanine-endopeptidase (penicillin-binding protein 4)